MPDGLFQSSYLVQRCGQIGMSRRRVRRSVHDLCEYVYCLFLPAGLSQYQTEAQQKVWILRRERNRRSHGPLRSGEITRSGELSPECIVNYGLIRLVLEDCAQLGNRLVAPCQPRERQS